MTYADTVIIQTFISISDNVVSGDKQSCNVNRGGLYNIYLMTVVFPCLCETKDVYLSTMINIQYSLCNMAATYTSSLGM